MLLITCPYCGERPELEFRNMGEAHIARPAFSDRLTDGDWEEFLYLRSNPKGLAIELAIRALARADAGAAQAVATVDVERLAHVTKLFAELGWPAADAETRAVLFYSYLFGQSLLDRAAASPTSRDGAVEMLLRPPG